MMMLVSLTGPTGSASDLIAELESIQGIQIVEVKQRDPNPHIFGRPQSKGQFDVVDLAISFAVSIGSSAAYDLAKAAILALARKHGFSSRDSGNDGPGDNNSKS
jgi:hypothetical protein